MKTIPLFLIATFLLFPVYSYSAPPAPPPPSSPSGSPPPSTLGAMRISLLDGDVQIKTEETGDWVPASINMPLRDGDQLWVPEGGRTELQMRDGSVLRLDQQTALDILAVGQDSFQIYLAEGRIFANFRGLRGTLLQVDTSVSSVRVYDNAVFRADVSGDGYAEISVYRGSVYAESQDGKTTVAEGNILSLKGDNYAEISALGPPDEWENWNRERDRKYAQRRPSSPYLPEELQTYSADFDENGKWVRVPQYGYVWTPTVVVSAEWAPYRLGRWAWIGGDYVWVSYEGWGWAPYHYGRWAFVGSVGWCWVPPRRGAVYWGPGFVGWVQTPTYVSWVPLAPGEIYYGHGYYGPHSVNIANVNVANINIVYRNIRVRNAVTVIHHDTFVTGRHVDFHIRENPFLRERIHIGRPDIRPERATFMPVVREIPHGHRPPEAIRDIRVREIRERRPLVRERESSVFGRETPHKEMTLKPREGKPAERGVEKAREHWPRPPEREIGKPREPRSGEKGLARPKEIGKPREPRPGDKELGRLRETPPKAEFEKPAKERRVPEKGGDRPKGGRAADKEVDKRRE